MSGSSPLTVEERETISRELSRSGSSVSARSIGRLLGRYHSTVSREIDRNGEPAAYRTVEAQLRCDESRLRLKERKLEVDRRLHDVVNDGFAQKWLPRQIGKRLRVDHPDDPRMRVSHETITSACTRRLVNSCGPSWSWPCGAASAQKPGTARSSASTGRSPIT
jgi:IS30 family transposase